MKKKKMGKKAHGTNASSLGFNYKKVQDMISERIASEIIG